MKKFLAFMLTVFLLATTVFATGALNFFLLERDGVVSVFRGIEREVPELMTDILVCSLPSADREMLKNGIEVEGKDSLLRILEDLGS